jgi:hypothetical protein
METSCPANNKVRFMTGVPGFRQIEARDED